MTWKVHWEDIDYVQVTGKNMGSIMALNKKGSQLVKTTFVFICPSTC